MKKLVILCYGITVYAIFFGTFLYLAGFITNLVVPRSVDSGASTGLGEALIVNVLIVALFGVQHSIMARPAFKARMTKIIPAAMERSTFVLLTCGILTLLFWQWRTVDTVVWSVDSSLGQGILWAIGASGWGIVFLSTFMIDHFELFGLKQVVQHFRGKGASPASFKLTGFYSYVRHPLMLGFMLAFWAAPTMTVGHLILAASFTLFILVALQLEERDLVRAIGDDYVEYQHRVPMLLPFPWRTTPEAARPGGSSAAA